MKPKTGFAISALLLATVATVYAGISGTGVASGLVTRLSSVVVAGVVYDTSSAEIIVNGHPGTEADLAAGQVVDVFGNVNADGVTGSATRVVVADMLRASVDEINTATGELTVAGQQLDVQLTTLFGSSDGLAGISVGDVVSVFGPFDEDGDVVPSLVTPASGDDRIIVTGDADSVDGDVVTINDLVVDLAGVTNPISVSEGDRVRVEGLAFGSSGELLATTARLIDVGIGLPAGASARATGLVTEFDEPVFSIDGKFVLTNPDTVKVGPPVRVGASVVVDGTVDENGFIVAASLRVLEPANARVEGVVSGIFEDEIELDHTIEIEVDDLTSFQDLSAVSQRTFGLEHLSIGDTLDVRAFEREDNGNEIDAVAIIRTEASGGAAPDPSEEDDD